MTFAKVSSHGSASQRYLCVFNLDDGSLRALRLLGRWSSRWPALFAPQPSKARSVRFLRKFAPLRCCVANTSMRRRRRDCIHRPLPWHYIGKARDEHPFPIAFLLFEPLEFRRKVRDLDGMLFGCAPYANNGLPVWREEQQPICLTRHRVRVKLAQVVHRIRIARVAHEFVERAGLVRLAQGCVRSVAGKRALKFAADEKQFLFGRAPLIDFAQLDRRGCRHANDSNQDQKRQVRVARLPHACVAAVASHVYRASNGCPLRSVPGAPLVTSKTLPGNCSS